MARLWIQVALLAIAIQGFLSEPLPCVFGRITFCAKLLPTGKGAADCEVAGRGFAAKPGRLTPSCDCLEIFRTVVETNQQRAEVSKVFLHMDLLQIIFINAFIKTKI